MLLEKILFEKYSSELAIVIANHFLILFWHVCIFTTSYAILSIQKVPHIEGSGILLLQNHSSQLASSGILVGVVMLWVVIWLLTQHISGLVTKYKLLYVSNQGRAGARAWARVRAKG